MPKIEKKAKAAKPAAKPAPKVEPHPGILLYRWVNEVFGQFGFTPEELPDEATRLSSTGARMSEHDRKELLAVLTSIRNHLES